jgi:formaldehyde-activating enzyme involved in methanogenesis
VADSHIMVGESLVGAVVEVAHIDLIIGQVNIAGSHHYLLS